MIIPTRFGVTAVAAVIAAFSTGAVAQISNRPYDFPGTDGPGMSVAARQAIILNEIDPSFRPDFLLRAPGGGLLTVVPNPNGSNVPLVFGPDGFLIPSFRRGFRGGAAPAFGAGIFNPFFAGGHGDGGYGVFPAAANSISVWTSRVLGSGGFGPGRDSITDWTAAAYFLGGAR